MWHILYVTCSTWGLHHLIVLTLGWDQGTHNGAFLSCNDPNKAHFSPETDFGHRLANWLIINVKLRSIIVQSLHLFVKHVGSAGLQSFTQILRQLSRLHWIGPKPLSKTNKIPGNAVSAENEFASHQKELCF